MHGKLILLLQATLFAPSVLSIESTVPAPAAQSETVISGSESRALLADLLPSATAHRRLEAIERISASGDRRYTAPLIDLVRFATNKEELLAIASAALKLSGAGWNPDQDLWETLIAWQGQHDEVMPPSGYTGWKGELHAQTIDPRFREFLYEGAPASARVEEVVWGGVRVDGIPALVNPKMLPAAKADYLTDSEPVFGVSLNGDQRAYPLRILDWHEMANDVVGGVPVALAYCTLCGAGILYDVRVDGTTYEFGSSGFLMRSNKLMYDRQTKTLWNQLTGEPVIGQLAGKRTGRPIALKVLPVVLTSWAEWRRQHPDTKVLSLDTGHERPYNIGATYGRYFATPDTMFPVWQQSKQLPRKARVYALQLGGAAKAYPLDALNRDGGVVNDTLGGENLVVVYRDAVGRVPLPDQLQSVVAGAPNGGAIAFANDLTFDLARHALNKDPALIAAFSPEVLLAMPTEDRLTLLDERTSDERTGADAQPGFFSPELRNEVAQRGLIGETRAYARGTQRFKASPQDRDTVLGETGQSWQVAEDALIGPGGERLERLGGHLAYWFGWFSYFPKTEVYRAASDR